MSNVDETAVKATVNMLIACIVELSDRINEIDTQGVYTEDALEERAFKLAMEEIDQSG